MKFFLVLFFPLLLFAQQSKLSKGVNFISGYIASEKFGFMLNEVDHILLTDSIYLKTIKFYKEDFDEALLALTFGTVPYKEVPIKLPLIKTVIYYPLVSSDDSTFNKKNQNLPKYLFFDSPQNDYGDKDKLAHFFGNAFIAYSSNIFDLGDLIGYFVEVFEEEFKVQSSVDERDLVVNKLGYIFGKFLKQNENILPSHVILLFTLKHFNYHL